MAIHRTEPIATLVVAFSEDEEECAVFCVSVSALSECSCM